jgi:hypothetical protein
VASRPETEQRGTGIPSAFLAHGRLVRERDKVDFSSDPTGAKVYVNGQLMGTTPFETKLESKHTYTIEFRKEGYENRTVMITNSVGAGWIVLDVLFILLLVPIIVDAATGNWYSLDQDRVNAPLEPVKTTH